MLDHFMKVAYAKSQEDQRKQEVHELLKTLPFEDLYKLASGEVTKEAYLDGPCEKSGDSESWIDRFKGTPLFDQAIALAQEEIQVDMDDLQKKQEERTIRQSETSVWDLKDQIRLKKKLLELQAAQAEVGELPQEMDPAAVAEVPAEDPKAAAMGPPQGQKPPPPKPAVPEAGTQGAGAIGPESPNPEKTVTAAAISKMADQMGRSLARSDFNKEASQRKTALDMNAVSGVGKKLLGGIAGNKGALIGGAIGAAGGLANGLQKDQNGQRHVMSGLAQGAAGGLAGAAAGHAVSGIGSRMANGSSLGQAAGGYATNMKRQGQAALMQAGAIPGKGSVSPATSMGAAAGRVAPAATPGSGFVPKPAPQLGGLQAMQGNFTNAGGTQGSNLANSPWARKVNNNVGQIS